MSRTSRTSGATAAAVGRHLDMSRQRVGQLCDEGVFARSGDGRFDVDACRFAYIRWLRDEDRRANKSAVSSRVTDARTREIELRIAEREGRLIETERALEIVDDIVGIYRSAYGGLAARVTRDIALRRKVQAEIDVVQSKVASTLRKRRSALRTGRGTIEGEPED